MPVCQLYVITKSKEIVFKLMVNSWYFVIHNEEHAHTINTLRIICNVH